MEVALIGRPGQAPEPEALEKVYEVLGHRFQDPGLLVRAFTHTSYANEHPEAGGHNERLEFLGDAVLDLVLSHRLMETHPDSPEGMLSRLRAAAVNESRLSAMAREMGLGEFLLLGRGEERTGGREKDSVLADVYEACVGAIFLDGGFDVAASTVQSHFANLLGSLTPDVDKDYKTRLQELTQSMFHTIPVYTLVSEKGPDHAKTFAVELTVDGTVRGVGKGKSKKEAEQRAARQAWEALRQEKTA